ncbi:MAG: hypothetical protein V3T42_08145 [Nitrospirales bacterium]
MSTIKEIQEAVAHLTSPEGTLGFLSKRTHLSPERVSSIQQVGEPWPLPEKIAATPEYLYMKAAERGETHTEDGVNIAMALNALIQLREMDRERGETIGPFQDIDDHLKEVARLSGEPLEVIYEVYQAEVQRLLRVTELVERFGQLQEKEEN